MLLLVIPPPHPAPFLSAKRTATAKTQGTLSPTRMRGSMYPDTPSGMASEVFPPTKRDCGPLPEVCSWGQHCQPSSNKNPESRSQGQENPGEKEGKGLGFLQSSSVKPDPNQRLWGLSDSHFGSWRLNY